MQPLMTLHRVPGRLGKLHMPIMLTHYSQQCTLMTITTALPISVLVYLSVLASSCSKYILNDYYKDYRTRLISLHLLPLMYWLELQDLMSLVKCFKHPTDEFDISNHVKFISTSTRASSHKHLQHNIYHSPTTRHFYFNRIVPLWNSLPSEIDLHSLYQVPKSTL